MNSDSKPFEQLLSDEVFLAGVHASDVRALWRALARTPEARKVADALNSEPETIAALVGYVEKLIAASRDPAYRHPDDMAICCALVVLEQSPLPVVRHLFARLRDAHDPSMVWVRRMARHCDERFVPMSYERFPALDWRGAARGHLAVRELPGLVWADPAMAERRHELNAA